MLVACWERETNGELRDIDDISKVMNPDSGHKIKQKGALRYISLPQQHEKPQELDKTNDPYVVSDFTIAPPFSLEWHSAKTERSIRKSDLEIEE